jgi:hypothetical protein
MMKERLLLNLRYCAWIFPEGPRKSTNILSHDRRDTDQISNGALPIYKSEKLASSPLDIMRTAEETTETYTWVT